MAGISYRPENAAADVVEQYTRYPCEIDGQIAAGFREDVLRRLHESQHGSDDELSHHSGQQAERKGQRDGGVHRPAQPFNVVGAIALGNHHGRTGGQARAEPYDGVDDGTCGAYSGLRLLPDEASHHQGIHSVVQLLEQQTYGHGDRKLQ